MRGEHGVSEAGSHEKSPRSLNHSGAVDGICFPQRVRGLRPPIVCSLRGPLLRAVERELNPLDVSVSLELERVKLIWVNVLTQQQFAVSNLDGASVSLDLRRYSTECNVALKNLTLSFISQRREARIRRTNRGVSVSRRRRLPSALKERAPSPQLAEELGGSGGLSDSAKVMKEDDQRSQKDGQQGEPVQPYGRILESVGKEREGSQPLGRQLREQEPLRPVVGQGGSRAEESAMEGDHVRSAPVGFRKGLRTESSLHPETRTLATKIIGILPNQPYVLRVTMRSLHPLLPSFAGYALELGVDIGAIELVYLHKKFWKLFDWILDSFIGTLTASPAPAHPPPSVSSPSSPPSSLPVSSVPVAVPSGAHWSSATASPESSRGQFFANIGLYRLHRLLDILTRASQAPSPSRPLIPPVPFHVPVQGMAGDVNLGRRNILRCSCGMDRHSTAASAYLAKVRAMKDLGRPALHLYSYHVTIRSPLVFVPGAVSPVVGGAVSESHGDEKTRWQFAGASKQSGEARRVGEVRDGTKSSDSVTEEGRGSLCLSAGETVDPSSLRGVMAIKHSARHESLPQGQTTETLCLPGEERRSAPLSPQEGRTTTAAPDASKRRKEKSTSVERSSSAFQDELCPGIELRLGDFSVTNRISCEPGRWGLVEEVKVRLMKMKGTVRWRRLRTPLVEEGGGEEKRRKAVQGNLADEGGKETKGERRRSTEIKGLGKKEARETTTIQRGTTTSFNKPEENEVVLKEMDVVVRFIRGLNNSRRKRKWHLDEPRTRRRVTGSGLKFRRPLSRLRLVLSWQDVPTFA